jgi:uncharacterized FAD-dependent dehydrogenase
MVAKGFGVGMRIEHPREYINDLVYGKNHDSRLPSASYHFVTHLPSGRSVYSFCMCPGGSVVAATSSEGGVVTNGMSEYARMADNSNAAILVSVTPEDFGCEGALAGLEYQKKLEAASFLAGGGGYRAPAISLSSFVNNEGARLSESVATSYPRGTQAISPEKYLPDYITESLRAGFMDFDAWMKGYYMPEAVLTGTETRSTSPVKVLRTDGYEAIGASGLYPVGEGAGYAGGIISSAADGLRCAISIIEKANSKCLYKLLCKVGIEYFETMLCSLAIRIIATSSGTFKPFSIHAWANNSGDNGSITASNEPLFSLTQLE